MREYFIMEIERLRKVIKDSKWWQFSLRKDTGLEIKKLEGFLKAGRYHNDIAANFMELNEAFRSSDGVIHYHRLD